MECQDSSGDGEGALDGDAFPSELEKDPLHLRSKAEEFPEQRRRPDWMEGAAASSWKT